jgi:hypothetical protein
MGIFFAVTGTIGFLAGGERIYSKLDALVPKNEKIVRSSAWQKILSDSDDEHNEVVVGVQMKSGVWLQGTFVHHTHSDEDSGDRALVLQGPLSCRNKDALELERLVHFDRLVVQSSDVDYIVSFPRARA